LAASWIAHDQVFGAQSAHDPLQLVVYNKVVRAYARQVHAASDERLAQVASFSENTVCKDDAMTFAQHVNRYRLGTELQLNRGL
jgi:hypothetical protein